MATYEFYWFSGTGNTWMATQALADALRAGGDTVTVHRLEAAGPVNLASDAILGLAFPIACFSTYPVVWRFVEALPAGEGRGVVMLATMGGASAGMAGPLGRFLRRKGYRTLGARAFTMPGNYNNRTIPVEANAALVERMQSGVAAYAEDLRRGRATWTDGYPIWSEGWRRLSATSRPWRFFKKVFPLAVDRTRCTRCGLCSELCPARCIRMEDGPVWEVDACQACQRCIGYCPVHAIHVPGKPAQPYAVAPLEAMRGE